MSEVAEITKVLLDYFEEGAGAAPAATVEPDTPLAESGILDSLGFMDFVTFLESRFGISMDPEDYTSDNLETVRKCAAFLHSRLAVA